MLIFEISCSSVEVLSLNDVAEIYLGGKGRGRKQVIIPILGDSSTSTFGAKKTENGIVLVAQPKGKDRRCLAIIDSSGGYDKGRAYSIPDMPGLTKLAIGYYAAGMAGRAMSAEESLCIVAPGVEFKLRGKYHSNWFCWDGEKWVMESPAQRNSRLALEEVAQGGGEWL